MSKMSFLDKLGVLVEVSKSSYLFLVVFALLLIVGIVFFLTNKRNAKRSKIFYISCSIFIIAFLIIGYHASLGSIFDYMMDNFFIAIYFPNLAIYLAAIIITNIILWISLFNYRTSEVIRKINIVVYLIMNYLLALILSVVNTEQLDVFTQSSVYTNEKATALIELSSVIFIAWIIFLVFYKLILVYIRKDYEPKVKKVIKVKKVKKLPENFEPTMTPDYIYGRVSKVNDSIMKPIPEIDSFVMEIPQQTTIEVKPIEQNQKLINEFEKMFTLDDYKLLSKMLKEQREKEKQQEIINRSLWAEEEKREIIRLEEERKESLRREQLRIEEMKRQEELREQDKFTELEMLYRSIR